MRQYLLYSGYAHLALVATLLFVFRNSLPVKKAEAYYIDFIGPSKVVTMQKAAEKEGPQNQPELKAPPQKAAQKAALPAQKPDDDDFSSGALPKPSVLASGAKLIDEAKNPAAAEAGQEGAPLITDSANFPYPWYITQVREALWNSWTARMPSAGSLRCTVRFSIQRDGSAGGVSVEKSSGNRLFDNAAQSSVESAAPFAALPDDFYEDKLTVHVEFKAME
jgi:protein TonB